MSVYRSYFSAQATLLRDNPTNNSKNPIIEFSYGGSSTAANSKIGRYIFKVDLEGLKTEISGSTLTRSNTVSHKIFLKNVIAQAPDLAGQMMDDAKRGSGLTLSIYPLGEDFDEGNGYDYLYAPTVNYQYDPVVNAPNWTHRKTNTPWAAPGTFQGVTPAQPLASFRLENGNEDAVFDITDYMNEVLFSNRQHYGLGIFLSGGAEALTSDQRRVVTFFSKYTQSFFEPYLETSYGSRIWEDRCTFPLDQDNYLYLQTKKPIQAVQKVEIYDNDDRLIMSKPASDVEKMGNNLYRVPCAIASTAYPDLIMFQDVWYCQVNNVIRKQEQEFTLFQDSLALETGVDEYAEYWFSLSGIRHNETVRREKQKRRVVVNAKRLFNGAIDTDPDLSGLTYRLYILSGKYPIEVIPPTPVSKLHDLIFFDLDLSWLISQQYYLEVQMETGGRVIRSQQPTKFRKTLVCLV
jgi:hypothetical protein